MADVPGEFLLYTEGRNEMAFFEIRREVHKMFNPYLAQWLREERVKDALRKEEQAPLIRAAKGPRKSRERLRSVTQILKTMWVRVAKRKADETRSLLTAQRETRKIHLGS